MSWVNKWGGGLWLCCALSWACGQQSDRTAPTPEPTTEAYLDEVKEILRELRALEREIGQATQGDTIAGDAIAPLVETRFRPAMAELRERAGRLKAPVPLRLTQQKLLDYFALRLEAYDALLLGVRQNDAAALEQFARLQVAADQVGKSMQHELQIAKGR